eukprot:570695-Rhodomonas_salina.1
MRRFVMSTAASRFVLPLRLSVTPWWAWSRLWTSSGSVALLCGSACTGVPDATMPEPATPCDPQIAVSEEQILCQSEGKAGTDNEAITLTLPVRLNQRSKKQPT